MRNSNREFRGAPAASCILEGKLDLDDLFGDLVVKEEGIKTNSNIVAEGAGAPVPFSLLY